MEKEMTLRNKDHRVMQVIYDDELAKLVQILMQADQMDDLTKGSQ